MKGMPVSHRGGSRGNPAPRGSARRLGFTLIELLVVVAIIAILVAMLLPAIAQAKASAQSAGCRSHLRQMGIALRLYLDANGQRYPLYVYYRADAHPDDQFYWENALEPYYARNWGTNRLYHCPAYRNLIARPKYYAYYGSYAYNVSGTVTGALLNNAKPQGLSSGYHDPGISETEVRVPAEMIAMGDSRISHVIASATIDGKVIPTLDGYFGSDWLIPGPSSFANAAAGLSLDSPLYPARHGRSYNVAFCDGQVVSRRTEVLFSFQKSATLWNRDHQPHPETWY